MGRAKQHTPTTGTGASSTLRTLRLVRRCPRRSRPSLHSDPPPDRESTRSKQRHAQAQHHMSKSPPATPPQLMMISHLVHLIRLAQHYWAPLVVPNQFQKTEPHLKLFAALGNDRPIIRWSTRHIISQHSTAAQHVTKPKTISCRQSNASERRAHIHNLPTCLPPRDHLATSALQLAHGHRLGAALLGVDRLLL